jgi:hypothetical protein
MMMKKIKSNKHLKAERKKIRRELVILENRIRGNWDELKAGLRPAGMARDAFQSVFNAQSGEKPDGNAILKSAFSFGVSLLAKKFTEKAFETWDKVFTKNGKAGSGPNGQ